MAKTRKPRPQTLTPRAKRSAEAGGAGQLLEDGRRLVDDARPVVVTTGTGSGKTETFLLPAIQNAWEDAARFTGAGLTAILVYPMNALASDQEQRIRDYLEEAGFTGAIIWTTRNHGSMRMPLGLVRPRSSDSFAFSRNTDFSHRSKCPYLWHPASRQSPWPPSPCPPPHGHYYRRGGFPCRPAASQRPVHPRLATIQ